MSEAPRIAPRPEACVLRPEDLTFEQREAALRVQGLVNVMACEEWKSREFTAGLKKILPRIDEQREARIVLIDGDRGSGKTSVLLTVLDFWRRVLVRETLENFSGWATPEQPVVPVGLIELHPLPPSTNFLVYIASALQQVVEAIEDERHVAAGDRRTAPWHPVQVEELQSRERWRTFFAAAARGWDGNWYQRQQALDAEGYAMELEHAERQRLDVISAFRWFMDALVTDFQRWQGLTGRVPLFVVSLDDADLNPRFVVELLDLLRALYHPRLAFILSGSSDLFLTMLQLQGLGAYLEPLRGIQVVEGSRSDIEAQADRIASGTYDKLIPDGHRCRIDSLDPRFRYRKVQEALSTVRVTATEDPPGACGNLSYYFDNVGQLANALPATMRGLIDLGTSVQMPLLEGLVRAPRIAERLVKRLWDDASRATPRLAADKSHLESVVQIDDQGKLFVRSSSVRWRRARETRSRIPIDDRRVLECAVLQPLGGALMRGDAEGPVLSDSAVAAFMLANMLSLDVKDDSLLRSPVTRQVFDTAYLFVDYGIPRLGRFEIGWPLFDPALLFDILLFGKRWAEQIDLRCSKGECLDVESLGVFFLDLALDIEKRHPAAEFPSKEAARGKWPGLAKRLVELGQQTHTSTRKWWLARWAREKAGLLATPECGLPDEAARAFLAALQRECGPSNWLMWCGGLTQARRQRARIALGLGGNQEIKEEEKQREKELIDAIDADHTRHPWLELEQRCQTTAARPVQRETQGRRRPR